MGLLLAGGCGPVPPTSGGGKAEQSALITRAQAEDIARAEATRKFCGHYAIEAATLEEERNWRVVIEFPTNQGSYLTNILPGTLSRTNAELLTLALAREELSGSGAPRILCSEFLEGFYWHVGVHELPAAPGAFFTSVISATDGSVLRSIPGM